MNIFLSKDSQVHTLNNFIKKSNITDLTDKDLETIRYASPCPSPSWLMLTNKEIKHLKFTN